VQPVAITWFTKKLSRSISKNWILFASSIPKFGVLFSWRKIHLYFTPDSVHLAPIDFAASVIALLEILIRR